jgi:hypothetical protein
MTTSAPTKPARLLHRPTDTGPAYWAPATTTRSL